MVATPRNAPDAAQVLAAIVEARTACLRVSDLAAAMKARRALLYSPLAELEASGLVTDWDMPTPPGLTSRAVTVTALAARQLGVRLDSAGERWTAEGEVEPSPRVPKRGPLCESGISARGSDPDASFALSSLADPEAEPPDVTLARWEGQVSRFKRDKRLAEADPEVGPPRIPLPRTLLGLRVQWQGPKTCEARGEACPGCRGRRLAPMEVCLACNRWGMDHALVEVGEPNRTPVSPIEAALLSGRAARVRGATSPLARTHGGVKAAEARDERDRVKRLRAADARDREWLLEDRRAAARTGGLNRHPNGGYRGLDSA